MKGPVAAWGDNRNTWTGPPGSAAPFTHAQPDVFFTRAENEPQASDPLARRFRA